MTGHLRFVRGIDEWIVTLQVARLSPATIRAYRRVLYQAAEHFGDDVDPRDLALEAWESFIALGAGLAANTQRNRISAMRSFDKWLRRRRSGPGVLDGLDPIRRDQDEPRRLGDDEIAALFHACADTRETVALVLLARLALRNHEARLIRCGDYDRDEATLLLRRGKGGKGRVLPVGHSSAALIEQHLAQLEAYGAAGREDYLLARRREGLAGPGGDERADELYPQLVAGPTMLNRLVARVAARAGLDDPDGVTPHMFRRWCLETFLAATGDLHAAADLAGHADVNQTRKYAGKARLRNTRAGVDAVELVTQHALDREQKSGRTWVRTRALAQQHDELAAGGPDHELVTRPDEGAGDGS